jgi:hypothetical protein
MALRILPTPPHGRLKDARRLVTSGKLSTQSRSSGLGPRLQVPRTAAPASSPVIKRHLSYALDRCRLMQAAGLNPDPWQERLLRSVSKKHLLLCSRQVGKTTVTAVVALAEALFKDGALILVLSPTLRQSQELYRAVRRVLGRLPDRPLTRYETSTFIELANGSRIVCLPGEEGTVRGYSDVTLLIVDEAARVPDNLYYVVRPMLAVSNGMLICLSTPYGKRGFFYHEWSKGEGWSRYAVTAAECPRITDEFLEQERNAVGELWFAQEYECQFIDPVHRVFDEELILEAFDPEVRLLFPREV